MGENDNEPKPVETLGARIKGLRTQRGWSQAELAAKIGLRVQQGSGRGATSRSIIQYEGDQVVPSRPKQLALARAFGVSVDYLMTGEGSDRPQAPATARERLAALEASLSETREEVARLGAPERRQGSWGRPESKLANEISELRADLKDLAETQRRETAELQTDLRKALRRIASLEAARGSGSSEGPAEG